MNGVYKIYGHGRTVLGYTDTYFIHKDMLFTMVRASHNGRMLTGEERFYRTDIISRIESVFPEYELPKGGTN